MNGHEEGQAHHHGVNSLLQKFEAMAQQSMHAKPSRQYALPTPPLPIYEPSSLAPDAHLIDSDAGLRYRSISQPATPINGHHPQISRPALRPNESSPNLLHSNSMQEAPLKPADGTAPPSQQSNPSNDPTTKTARRQPPPKPTSRPGSAAASRPVTPTGNLGTSPLASPAQILSNQRKPPPIPSSPNRTKALAIPGAATTENSITSSPKDLRPPARITSPSNNLVSSPISEPTSATSQKPPIPERLPVSSSMPSPQPNSLPPLPARRPTLEPAAPISLSNKALPPISASAPVEDTFKARPPPSRNVASNVRLAPARPNTTQEDESDEGSEEEGPVSARVDDVPDATFASRRPPELYPKKAMNSHTNLTCVATRGDFICVGSQHHLKIFSISTSSAVLDIPLASEQVKVTAVAFRCDGRLEDNEARFIWAGTKEGHLFEVDLQSASVIDSKSTAHSSPVTGIFHVQGFMITVDEQGKVQVWPNLDGHPRLSAQPRTQRMSDKLNFSDVLGSTIWAAVGPSSKQNLRTPVIRLYSPSSTDSWSLTPRPIVMPEVASVLAPSAVVAAARIPLKAGVVFLAHESGHISSWTEDTATHLSTLRLSSTAITSMHGVLQFLFVGFKTGQINVYDVESTPWKVIKSWQAHEQAVTNITVNYGALWSKEKLYVISTGAEAGIHVWDGFLADDWIDRELKTREKQYCTYKPLRVLTCTWNIDACKPSQLQDNIENSSFLPTLLASTESPDVIAFNFQELVDLQSKALTAKSILLGGRKKLEGKCQDSSVSSNYQHWNDKLVQAVRLAMPADSPYSVMHAESLIGLFSCIFIRNALKPQLRDLGITTVKTGMGRRYGNKGAIVARFVIEDSSVCLVNCHLAAGQSAVRQRNKDLIGILETHSTLPSAADFEPNAYIGGGDGSVVNDHDICILQGDLNYRIDMRRDLVVNHINQRAFDTLKDQDQLLKQMRTNPAFRLRSFLEAPLDFAPTYKYDRNSNEWDTSDKQRSPAWCDRILYRAHPSTADVVKLLHYQRYEPIVSDHRPVSAALDLKIKKIDHSRRAVVFEEIVADWREKEQSLLERAKEYYRSIG